MCVERRIALGRQPGRQHESPRLARSQRIVKNGDLLGGTDCKHIAFVAACNRLREHRRRHPQCARRRWQHVGAARQHRAGLRKELAGPATRRRACDSSRSRSCRSERSCANFCSRSMSGSASVAQDRSAAGPRLQSPPAPARVGRVRARRRPVLRVATRQAFVFIDSGAQRRQQRGARGIAVRLQFHFARVGEALQRRGQLARARSAARTISPWWDAAPSGVLRLTGRTDSGAPARRAAAPDRARPARDDTRVTITVPAAMRNSR